MLGGEEDQPRCSCHAFGLDLGEELVSGNHHAVHVRNGAPCRMTAGFIFKCISEMNEARRRRKMKLNNSVLL